MAMNQQWPSLTDLADDGETVPTVSNDADPDTLSATDLIFAGLRVARSGSFGEAAEIFAKAVLKDPECAEAYEALATVLVPLGKLEFASRAKAKAIGLGYDSASSWEMLGDMLVNLKKFNDAAEAYRSSVEIDPNSEEVQGKLNAALAAGAEAKRRELSQPDAEPFVPDALKREMLAPAWRRVYLITMTPDGNPHSAAFDDLASGLENSLRALGIDVERRINSFGNLGTNMVLGAHLIGSQETADRIRANTVIINLEQITGFDVKSRPVYLSLLKRLPVWDYSIRNIFELRRLTQNPLIRHFGIGYTPEMTKNLPSWEQPVDVLFYGSVNPRRAAILQALMAAGLNVKHLFSVYGAERDEAIAEAKVVLNMHYYEDSIHEIVRTSYLLANSKAVVSECGPKTEIDEDIREAVAAVPYEGIVQACVELVNDEPRRRDLERRAFDVFARRDQAKVLRDVIAATDVPLLA